MVRRIARMGSALALLVIASLAVAAAPAPFASAIEHARFVGAMPLAGEVFHVQGLAFEGGHIWVTSVDEVHHRGYLHEFDRASGAFVRRIDLTDGARYHPGGISIAAGVIWVPVSELRPNSSAVLEAVDTTSLRVVRAIHVADHLGCVAASPHGLVAGNWDSRLFYVFDLARGVTPRIMTNPFATRYQDMKFVGDRLVASGSLGLWDGALDWIEWPSLRRARSLHAGTIGPLSSFTGEGMAIEGRELYLLPEDGPSRVLHFRLDG